jgi:hypothetical protein
MSFGSNATIRLIGVVLAGVLATSVNAGEYFEAPDAEGRFGHTSDDCGFYRGAAFNKGLTHFATEMLWACEAIQERRNAGMRLSPRLSLAADRMDAYRTAVVQASVAALGTARKERRIRLGLGEAEQQALARSTGALDALEAIRAGF